MARPLSYALTFLLICTTCLNTSLRPVSAQSEQTSAGQADATPTIAGQPLETVVADTPTSTPSATEIAPSVTATSAPSATDPASNTGTEIPGATATPSTVLTPEVATSTSTAELHAAEAATLQVRTVDTEGNPFLNLSYYAYQKTDEGSYLWPPFESWDFEDPDGTSLFPPIPTGVSIAVVSKGLPRGYLGPTGELAVVSLVPGETRTIEIVLTLGGTLTVHGVDQTGAARPDGCYVVYEDIDGSRGDSLGGACDRGPFGGDLNDGLTLIDTLPGGSFLLGSWSESPYWVAGPDVPFTIDLGGTAEVTATFIPAATVVIHKRTAEGVPLPSSCFIVYRDDGGGQHGNSGIGGGCDHADGSNDGEITFPAPLGDVVIAEDQVPVGYVAAEETLAHLESGQTATFTIVDPLASTLIAQVTDLWSHPILESTCLRLNADAGGGVPGDFYDERCTNNLPAKHEVAFAELPPGNYVLSFVSSNKPGYYRTNPLLVAVGLSVTKTVKFKLNGPPPAISVDPYLGTLSQTEALIHWQTDQPSIGSIRYGLSESFGRNAGPTASEQRTHRLLLTGLSAGKTYYFELKNTNANGTVRSVTYYFRTPPASNTASLLITKTNSDGSVRLGGSCFVVHRDLGSGTIGSTVGGGCDKFDATPNDGQILIKGLAGGAYVLVEILSPTGYSLAANTRFSLTDGQAKKVTVKDYRGGAVLTVTTRAFTGSSDAPLLPGACYAIYANVNGSAGARISSNCDTYDGLDGKTRLGALRAGQYFLEITEVPLGYMPAGLQQYWAISISSGQTSASYLDHLPSETAPDNIVLRAVDGAGTLLPGACFALYETLAGPDPLMDDACDEDDGHVDGRTIFKNMPGIRYTAAEYVAPPGYQVGTRVSFTKTESVLRTVSIVQVPGALKVRVTTVKGDSTTKLRGACYGLYTAGGYHDFVTGACDFNLDGIVEMIGIPAGSYLLAQTQTPPGYKTPPYRTITVGTQSISVTFKTFPA